MPVEIIGMVGTRDASEIKGPLVDGPVVDLAEAPDPDDAGGVIVRVDPGVGVVGVDAEELSARVGAAR